MEVSREDFEYMKAVEASIQEDLRQKEELQIRDEGSNASPKTGGGNMKRRGKKKTSPAHGKGKKSHCSSPDHDFVIKSSDVVIKTALPSILSKEEEVEEVEEEEEKRDFRYVQAVAPDRSSHCQGVGGKGQ